MITSDFFSRSNAFSQVSLKASFLVVDLANATLRWSKRAKSCTRIWIALFLMCAWLLPLAAASVLAVASPVNDITLTLSSTSRQIIVSYTAPDTSPCTVEVSESAGYSPLVNDVKATLFSGSNSDSRTGALGVGTTSRVMVIGTVQQPNGVTRLVAGDNKTYPRVLQVNTMHYLRVTCGSHIGTGSIATKNIPLGKTWGEPTPMTAAGTYGFPTLDGTNRGEAVLDPQLGTLLRKVSITGDNAWAGS